MSPAERALIGNQLGIAEVFIAALKELIIRPDTLNDEEASQLGGKITFRVMQLREQTHVSGKALQGKPDDVQKAIHWTFRTELNEMKFHIGDGAHLDVLKKYVNDRPSASAKKLPRVSTSSKITENPINNVFPTRNAYYYDPEVDIVIFQVENELFRVHKEYFVKHSPVFREMFQVRGQTSQAYLEGKTDEHPLCLQGISKDSFVLFLSVIHPDVLAAKTLEHNQWEKVIELALLWRMRSLRLHCIERLSPLPNTILPIEKILLSRKYMAQEWLVEAYLQLAQRSEIITNSEASQLGVASAFLLVQLQAEQFKSLASSTDSKKSTASVSADHVRRSFCDELQRLDSHDSDSEIGDITELMFD